MRKRPIILREGFCFGFAQLALVAALASGVLAIRNQMSGAYIWAIVNTICFGVNGACVMVQAFVIEKMKELEHVA